MVVWDVTVHNVLKSCNNSEARAASIFMAEKWGKKVCDIRKGELRLGL